MPGPERGFQKRIEDMLSLYGWKWWHVPAPMRFDERGRGFIPAKQAAGLCDIIATHHDPPRLLFLEVKGDRGKLSEKQREFLLAVKLVAETMPEWADGWVGQPEVPFEPIIGVHAVWPKDEQAVEQMLRSKIVA